MAEQAHYRHDLGEGHYFDAYSLSPEVDEKMLADFVAQLDGKSGLDTATIEKIKKDVVKKASVKGIGELEIVVSEQPNYQVPDVLKPYRDAIGADWDAKGRFNGPVLIVDGELKVPLKVMQGGYYDFAATKLGDIPAKILPKVYPAGKTIADILRESGDGLDARARYFGFAHLMWPSHGEEFLLVQRAKGMGIAADCVSTPGSTPDIRLRNSGLQHPEFDIPHYWSYHFAEEMKDEFHLNWGDFWTGQIDLFEDARMIPFGAIKIVTPLSARQIAAQAYGDPRVLKEHTALYSMPGEAIPAFLKKIPILSNLVPALI